MKTGLADHMRNCLFLLLVWLGGVLIAPTPAAAGLKSFLGNIQNGFYGNQDNRIVLFCIDVSGEFSYDNVNGAVQNAVGIIRNAAAQHNIVKTLNTNQQINYHTFINDTCIVYGFVDIDTGSIGWLAMTNTSQTTSQVMRNNAPNSWGSDGWQKDDWQVEGWRIHIQGADDDNGNINMGASVAS